MGTSPHFDVLVERSRVSGETQIRVTGEVDIATAPKLAATLGTCDGALGIGAVLLDLTAVTFLDSTGLGVILRANDILGGRLRVASSPACERLFEIAGVRDRLPLVGSEVEG